MSSSLSSTGFFGTVLGISETVVEADEATAAELVESSFFDWAAFIDAAVTTFTTTAFFVGDLYDARLASALAREAAVGEVRVERLFVASIFWALGEVKDGFEMGSADKGL